MRIPAQVYEVCAEDTDRLIDRLNEAIALDFTDARDNGPALRPSPDVIQVTAEAHDEYERLLEMLRAAGGARFLGNRRPSPAGATLTVLLKHAMPLLRRITHLLRHAGPQIETASSAL